MTPSSQGDFSAEGRDSPGRLPQFQRQNSTLMKRYSHYEVPRAVTQGSGDEDHLTKSTMVGNLCLITCDSLTNTIQMIQYLYRRFREQGWLESDPTADSKINPGLLLQVDLDQEDLLQRFIMEPKNIDQRLLKFAATLNMGALATLSSDITGYLFSQIQTTDVEVTLRPHNITVPVIESLEVLIKNSFVVTRRDFCCLLRREKLVLVWSQSGEELMPQTADVESKLMGSVRFVAYTTSLRN